LLEKCTELGVSEVVPLQSQYVESHLVEQYQKKRVRFERFCIDAMKQSGSPFLPKLRPCVDLQDAVQSLAQEGLHCLAVEPHRAHEPTHAFGRGSALPNDLSQRVCLWVGPEAGWGPKDEGQLARLRAHPLTFADVVFRAETAALFFISVIRYSASDGFLSGPH
jgi:16S rRNA (uracil1498-N3)-methyltransferase